MAENVRKRSRKTKLVPRDCADTVEDDSVLQEPASKKLLLAKIKKEPVDYVPKDPPAHQFSVNVEVEDMDGSVPDEDPSNYMQYLFSLSQEPPETEPPNPPTLEIVDNSSLLEKQGQKITEEEKNCIVDVKKLKQMLAVLHKRFPDEKESVMYARNQWGKVFSEKFASEWRRTPQDCQVQEVLEKWKAWCVNTRARQTPQCYKCYICRRAWWNLTEFQSHITNHTVCKLELENRHHECYVIAYDGNLPEYKELHVHGKCHKCAKTYDQHVSSRSLCDEYYCCHFCQVKYMSCNSLARHEGTCEKNPLRLAMPKSGIGSLAEFPCKVCDVVFFMSSDLFEHMVICHKVRSDDPVVTKFKACPLCKQNYLIYNFHVCLKKNVNYECNHCHAKFQNRYMLENHMKMWDGVLWCRFCQKYIMRSCMAMEHYSLHSENFQMVHRCLVCKKIKVFVGDDALRIHKSKYHSRISLQRPCSDKIIVAKIMLQRHQQQQCLVDVYDRKTLPTILREKASLRPKSAAPKQTRRDTIKKVRIHVPINTTTATSNSENDSQIINTTIPHGNIVSMRPEQASPEIPTHSIKIEKDSTAESEKDNIPESEHIDNIVIKTEKNDDPNTVDNVEQSENAVEKEGEGTKDLPTILEELNEYLDLKPDFVKIKEERVAEDETAQRNLTDLLKITQTENNSKDNFESGTNENCPTPVTYAEEVTENSELSKVFKVSKSILELNIKKEIKTEPIDDMIGLDDSIRQESIASDSSERSLLNLEPEVILQAGYRKRKIYRCSKCEFSAYHREYKDHINSQCQKKGEDDDSDINYQCTKCYKNFPNLKMYSLHFEHHGYKYMSCPQCKMEFDSVTKLVPHVNGHIQNQFVRVKMLSDEEPSKSVVYQCKTCKRVRGMEEAFVHWERHLELVVDTEKVADAPYKVGENGELALKPDVLKQVLGMLDQQEKTPNRVKTCFVCARHFERKNDCKRHLIEHLLEDAYAKIAINQMLKCQICDELHLKPDSYKKHMRDHASLPIYQCNLCDKTFSDSSNFTKHKKIHNLKAYICDICSKKFQAKFSLERHMEMHMTTEPINCQQCDKVFYCSSFYKRHVRQYHNKAVNRYKCMYCKAKFKAIKQKWDHMWLVHKQRKENADCPVCGKSFRKFSDVKKHCATEHELQVTLSNVWSLLSNLSREKREAAASATNVKVERDSDDDCLVIEEERETLVVYD